MLYYVFIGLYSRLLPAAGGRPAEQGKGGDIAAAFGGASSQTAFGARAGATVLTRATTILGSLFMLGAFRLASSERRRRVGRERRRIAAGPDLRPCRPERPRCRPDAARGPSGWIAARSQPQPQTPPGKPEPAKPTPPHCLRRRAEGEAGIATETLRAGWARTFISPSSRKWRNWQTHQLEGLALARAWGFESPLPHHDRNGPRNGAFSLFWSPIGHGLLTHSKTSMTLDIYGRATDQEGPDDDPARAVRVIGARRRRAPVESVD